MKDRFPHRADYPTHLWLQPVSVNLDAFRQFAQTMDEGLAQLVAEHRTRQTNCTRPMPFQFGQADATNSAGEDVLPDQDIW